MFENTLQGLLDFLDALHTSGLAYSLSQRRPRMVMVTVDVPGERWEVEFGDLGEIEVERFVSAEGVEGTALLVDLFSRFAD